jgi:hypothetical protein
MLLLALKQKRKENDLGLIDNKTYLCRFQELLKTVLRDSLTE